MAKLNLTARFKDGGLPQTGLSPTVNVYLLDKDGNKTDLVTSGAMTELSDGFYLYSFENFSVLSSYLFSYDAGADSDDRNIENSWMGLEQWIAAMPRSTGGGSDYSGLTKDEIKKIAEAMKSQVKDLFENLEFELPEQNFDGLKADIVSSSKIDQERFLKAIDAQLTAKLKEFNTPMPEIKVEKVDLSELKSELSKLKSTKLDVDATGVEDLLVEFAQLMNNKMNAFAKKLESEVMEVAEAKVASEMQAELMQLRKRK